MKWPGPVVLLSGTKIDDESDAMRFRLIYDGPLRATGRDPVGTQRNPLAADKHEIRKVFHRQLKRLWAIDRFLNGSGRGEIKESLVDWVANQHREHDYRFVPLVTEQWSLLCSLRILLLRRDGPGAVIGQAGDIDNRIKTLIDALRKPRNANELVGNEVPGDGEDPFFCLMEDDRLVNHLEVETDLLLDPSTEADADQSRVYAIVSVEVRPFYNTMLNLSFV